MCKVYTILPGRDFTFLKNHDNFKLKFCGGRAEKQSPLLQAFCVQLCCWGHRPFVCSRSLICARILHLDKGHTPSLHEDQMGTLSITVLTKFVPDYYYCYSGIHFQWSTFQSMKITMKGTCESRKAQVREGTSHSTRTYVLHLGVEHCTRWQLKRLNHDLSNTLWIRIQRTSQVRIQVSEWLCVNGKNVQMLTFRPSQLTEGPITHL